MRLLTEAAADAQEAPGEAPSAAAEMYDTYASALSALEDLPANQQEVIRLKFQHGMSYKQISQITQLSVTNVGFLLHVGLKALRRQLAGDEERGQPRARFGT
jgi:RNA polymerase sigma-70 factor (ECF subfamily)